MLDTTRKLLMRACPRCRGDLIRDRHEGDFGCLQCGRRIAEDRLAAAVAVRPLAARVAVA
jgi:hypothetical protein